MPRNIVGPDLAVDVIVARHHHRLLHGVVIGRPVDRENLKGPILHIETGEAGLKHHGEPQIAVGVRFEVERAGWKARL